MTSSENVERTSNMQPYYEMPDSRSLQIAPKIVVRGDVHSPGEFSYQREADVFHYLNLAGGALTDPKSCNLVVVRQYGDQKRSLLFRLDQRDYLPRVKQGDVIIISGLGESKQEKKQFHKPALVPQKPKSIIRTNAKDYENKLPVRGQALKRALSDYIRFPQFKRILNQIASYQAATGAKSIAIMSYESGEGKSFFLSALSLAYARFLHSRVLAIDSNKQETERSPYLAVVRGDYSTQIHNSEDSEHDAFVDLTSISEIEKEFHENSDFYFAPYITSMKPEYDLILVDTCAASKADNDVIDPMVIASQVDGVIIINSPASLEKKTMEMFSKDLRKCGAKVIGTVFNPFFKN